MAILFSDGFDYLTPTQSARNKWDVATGSIVTGVYGNGSALQGAVQKLKTLGANYVTGFVSFHYYPDALQAHTLVAFMDAGSIQVDLRIDGSGGLQFSRNGTLLGSVSTSKLAANTWYSIVLKVTIDASAGTVEVRVNGTAYIALTSQNTKATSNTFFNQLRIDTNANRLQRHDNFIFWDTSGGSGNDLTTFPTGEPIVDTSWMLTAGANADWTPSASTNVSNVDDSTGTATPGPDDDATYNSSLTPGNIDTFVPGALHAGSGTVLNVSISSTDRLDDATPHTVSHRYKSSSATTDSTAFTPSASYQNHQTFCPLDPNTAAAWTVTTRNAMQAGYKLIT